MGTTTVSGVWYWLSNDPIGIRGGLNLYVFCDNNPVNRLDPFGTATITINGQGYDVQSHSAFTNVVNNYSGVIYTFIYDGHADPTTGDLYLYDPHDADPPDAPFYSGQLLAWLISGASSKFSPTSTIMLRACGSCNPNVTCSAGKAFKKALPQANVGGYTGITLGVGPHTVPFVNIYWYDSDFDNVPFFSHWTWTP